MVEAATQRLTMIVVVCVDDNSGIGDDKGNVDDNADDEGSEVYPLDSVAMAMATKLRGLARRVSYEVALSSSQADVLEYYDREVNSPSGSFNIPAVLRVPYILQAVKKRQAGNTLSRRGVFRRDGYICQYCFSDKDLMVDHVIPASRGGRWTWENFVTACSSCNSRKGHKTLEEAKMTLIKMPKEPKEYEIIYLPISSSVLTLLNKKKMEMPEEWQQYLSES
ncbi:hypothetical protein AKJ16_DCAP10899 [Drosera capensis]